MGEFQTPPAPVFRPHGKQRLQLKDQLLLVFLHFFKFLSRSWFNCFYLTGRSQNDRLNDCNLPEMCTFSVQNENSSRNTCACRWPKRRCFAETETMEVFSLHKKWVHQARLVFAVLLYLSHLYLGVAMWNADLTWAQAVDAISRKPVTGRH